MKRMKQTVAVYAEEHCKVQMRDIVVPTVLAALNLTAGAGKLFELGMALKDGNDGEQDEDEFARGGCCDKYSYIY